MKWNSLALLTHDANIFQRNEPKRRRPTRARKAGASVAGSAAVVPRRSPWNRRSPSVRSSVKRVASTTIPTRSAGSTKPAAQRTALPRPQRHRLRELHLALVLVLHLPHPWELLPPRRLRTWLDQPALHCGVYPTWAAPWDLHHLARRVLVDSPCPHL